MPDPDGDILELIAAGRKIEAIKLAREHLGMGLAEAKAFVEGLEADARSGESGDGAVGGGGSGETGHWTSSSGARGGELFDLELDGLLRAKRKIDAVKLYRERAGCGLKDAKDAVELRAVELGLQSRPSKCFIATAAWGGGEQAEVMALRRFRNRVLRRRWWGRRFIRGYERVSPPLAVLVCRWELLAVTVRVIVRAAAWACGSTRKHSRANSG